MTRCVWRCGTSPAWKAGTGRTWCSTSAAKSRKDRKSTRLNSSHMSISYAVFCLKKKKTQACILESRRHYHTEIDEDALFPHAEISPSSLRIDFATIAFR